MKAPSRMAYWLVPAEPDLLISTIAVNEFAEIFDGPKFQPHATIYHGPFHPSDTVEEVLGSIAANGEVEWLVKKLCFGEKYTQSCYLEFENLAEFIEIRRLVLDKIKCNEDRVDFPHMSLFYGTLSESQREEISNKFKVPKVIKFSVVKAIANQASTQKREDVDFWHEVASKNLRNKE